jgi:hypothetical protein
MIRGVLAGAASPAPQFYATWIDMDERNGKQIRGCNSAEADGTTPVNLVGPVTETNDIGVSISTTRVKREIQTLSCYNADNAAVVITISWYDGTDEVTIFKAQLEAGEQVTWDRGYGWKVLTAVGLWKITVA